jgi:spermidine/putrescine-binding protein
MLSACNALAFPVSHLHATPTKELVIVRITGLANISTGLLPDPELAAIDALFDAPGDPRRPIDYHGIPVVAHPYGFIAHTCMVPDDEKPNEVSEALWDVLSTAERRGCDWVLFDRDEPM